MALDSSSNPSAAPSGPQPSARVPAMGVVIPTYNRREALLECLRHLERQTWKDFEVLVLDDGSSDGTAEAMAAYCTSAPFPVRFLRQENCGPAVARNRAIAEIAAPVSVLIGDDIFCRPEFLAEHLRLHREHPELEAVAVGLTVWSERGQRVTPFMQWVGFHGVQFSYAELLRGETPSWKHFYTSNLSYKTAYLQEHRFNEAFPNAAMEDIELGYRLSARHGLAMYFLPQAVAEHLHPTTFLRTCARLRQAGAGAFVFGQIWPEQSRVFPSAAWKRALLDLGSEPRVVLPLLTRAANISLHLRCPNALVRRVLSLQELAGYRQAEAAAIAYAPGPAVGGAAWK